MKHIFRIFIVISVAFILFQTQINISALNTGFSIESLSEKDKNTFISNIDLSTIDKEPEKETIDCFDVNKNGLIAIGQNISNTKKVCIYSNDGAFQYGYTFNCSGDFAVEWADEDLNIFFVRSDIIITVNQVGEILDIAKVENTKGNNSYIINYIDSAEKTVGNTKYILQNDMGILNFVATSYSQLVKINQNGESNIIYDTGNLQIAQIITISIVVVLLFALILLVVIYDTKEKAKKQSQQ